MNPKTQTEKETLGLIGVKRKVNLRIKDTMLKLKHCNAYSEADKKQPLAIIGSHNFLEISVDQGNAT